eukprot:287043-Pelagomonas_calceolata.AAC.4
MGMLVWACLCLGAVCMRGCVLLMSGHGGCHACLVLGRGVHAWMCAADECAWRVPRMLVCMPDDNIAA